MTKPRWDLYLRIAKRYMYLAFYDDPEDLRQDIIVALERIDGKNQYQATDSRLYYEARHVVERYVKNYEKEKNVKRYDTTEDDELDDDGEPKLRIDEIVADPKAPDLDAWLDAKETLRRLNVPKRLLDIAQKRVEGYP